MYLRRFGNPWRIMNIYMVQAILAQVMAQGVAQGVAFKLAPAERPHNGVEFRIFDCQRSTLRSSKYGRTDMCWPRGCQIPECRYPAQVPKPRTPGGIGERLALVNDGLNAMMPIFSGSPAALASKVQLSTTSPTRRTLAT